MVMDRLAVSKVEGVVGTLMTNMAIEVAFKAMQLPFVRAKVGDRYVLEQLNERGWLFGGEGSGHLLCLDKHTTGDGIVSALQVLSGLKRSGQSLADATRAVNLYPQTLINVKVAPGTQWQDNHAMVAELQAVEAELGSRGRVLIRPSGTEPLIRVMVEADDADLAYQCARKIADHLTT
jgi:phosphoglucosamine mutase